MGTVRRQLPAWAFHPVGPHTSGWAAVLGCVAASSRPWATQASLLVVNLCHVRVEDTDWEFSEFAQYDLCSGFLRTGRS